MSRLPEEALDTDLLRLLVESVVDYAIFVLDPDGRVASWNPGAERIKGWTQDEIIGRHFSTFYPPEDVDAGKPWLELEQARAEGRVEEVGWRLRKDGSTFWADVVITALRDPDGRLLGFAKVTRDLTHRRSGEQAAQQVMLLEEQERVARELNDSVIRNLFKVGMSLQGLATELTDERVQTRLNDAVDDLDRTIRELREHLFTR